MGRLSKDKKRKQKRRHKRHRLQNALTDTSRYIGHRFKECIKSDASNILSEQLFDDHVITHQFSKNCLAADGIRYDLTVDGRGASMYFYPHRTDSTYFNDRMYSIELLVKNGETQAGLRSLMIEALDMCIIGTKAERFMVEAFKQYEEETGVILEWEPNDCQLSDINDGYDGTLKASENVSGKVVPLFGPLKTDLTLDKSKLANRDKWKEGVALLLVSRSFKYTSMHERIRTFIRIARNGEIPRV